MTSRCIRSTIRSSLGGAHAEVALRGSYAPPVGREVLGEFGSVQLEGSGLAVAPEPAVVVLGPEDVPAMLDLVARKEPGPFRVRTVEMGTYLGFRHDEELVAWPVSACIRRAVARSARCVPIRGSVGAV
ncbi:hypothetical protein [Williamsia phyllosphaerae]|uniref:Uncharacterized protein n=1 Tax=Williamsia phyllosphaerae TaxID=885042 RepID=A0ABQ1UN52_9NOCA|nr:hypothetical protein [Williamsia phyllosphaerae]GGF22502.1 hypothetical protein GCM10007298_18080 [Williamsia phyllosphaerae]